MRDTPLSLDEMRERLHRSQEEARELIALEERKRALAKLVRKASWAVQLNEHIAESGEIIFRHACKLGFEGIVSKRLGSPYVSGRSRHWIKSKNPAAPAVKREAEEDWGR
jgi:bifunctional non-homologous end joining protein LigD